MAGIDKTYVNKAELIEAINWAKEIGEVTLENGYKFKPINYIYAYNDIDNLPDKKEYILWNTSIWFDRWLWCNCPLSFVQTRLQEQYDSYSLVSFDEWVYDKPEKRNVKYTFLKTPSYRYWKWIINNARRKNPWPHNCKQATYEIGVKVPNETFERTYDKQTNEWYERFGMLPAYGNYVWQKHHKRIPSKKSIIRQLRKWNLPKGTIVTVECLRYKDSDFVILVK